MIDGGRCLTSSPAELRWLMRRLREAGYRCGVAAAAGRQTSAATRLRGSAAAASPRHDGRTSLRLLVSATARRVVDVD